MILRNISILVALLFLGGPGPVWAQSEGDDLDVIELELDRATPRPAPAPETTAPTYIENPKENTLGDFSGLGKLAPFTEVSVIQKRFLPKTGRFQIFAGASLLTNNPFFNTVGGSLKAGYFLNENWGVELNYMGFSTGERQVTEELKDIQGVGTEALMYPKSFAGADIMYVPIYGKMSFLNERIIPFDLYFSAGYGMTGTKDGQSAGTIHLATGQIFSLSKSTALRWDFSWNFFNATNENNDTGSYNNLFLTVGMGWFFPEASYR